MSRILIVSAEVAVTAQVTEALAEGEWELSTTDTAAAAKEVVDAGDTDLVVAVEAADSDATAFAELMEECRDDDLPVLFLAASGETVSEHLSESGAQDWLSLPTGNIQIAQRIATLERVKRRFDQLRAQAVIDELTNSYNRRYMDEQMSVRLGEARRYDIPFSFMLFDLDYFKRINDTHGHQFGDVVLRQTADLVRELIRKEDVLTRYGGEEFAIISPHTDRLGSAILAERVREAVADNVFKRDVVTTSLTISLGVASFPLDKVESPEAMIETADKRLYEAKGAGRNQTVFE